MHRTGIRGDGASVGFGEAIRRNLLGGPWPLRGRASRSEFWFFTLFCTLVNITCAVVPGDLLDLPLVELAVWIFLAIMHTIVFVRRLHDVDRSGWWLLLAFTSIGGIPLLVWSLRRGDPAPNRFDAARRCGPSDRRDSALAIDRVERLANLRSSGAITDAEYDALKRAAL
jgi:hypothetical protein